MHMPMEKKKKKKMKKRKKEKKAWLRYKFAWNLVKSLSTTRVYRVEGATASPPR